jgi:hypothetical protein
MVDPKPSPAFRGAFSLPRPSLMRLTECCATCWRRLRGRTASTAVESGNVDSALSAPAVSHPQCPVTGNGGGAFFRVRLIRTSGGTETRPRALLVGSIWRHVAGRLTGLCVMRGSADGGRPGSGDGKGKHYGNEDGRLDRRKSPRSGHVDNSPCPRPNPYDSPSDTIGLHFDRPVNNSDDRRCPRRWEFRVTECCWTCWRRLPGRTTSTAVDCAKLESRRCYSRDGTPPGPRHRA